MICKFFLHTKVFCLFLSFFVLCWFVYLFVSELKGGSDIVHSRNARPFFLLELLGSMALTQLTSDETGADTLQGIGNPIFSFQGSMPGGRTMRIIVQKYSKKTQSEIRIINKSEFLSVIVNLKFPSQLIVTHTNHTQTA